MTVQDGWDPAQYNRFAAQREQPFWDLVQLLAPVTAPEVVDLGCGDGRLTGRLHEALGAAGTLGVDSSPAMIADAQAHAGGALRFRLGDIGAFGVDGRQDADGPAGGYDIVFANASLQWVPDHRAVLRRWAGLLRPGGQLAVQVPSNADHPGHRLAAELGAELLNEPPPDPVAEHVLPPEEYALELESLGFKAQHVRLQVYLHRLASTAEVVEWVKGTSLTRFKESFGDEGWPAFVDLYRARLLATLGEHAPYVYAFKRILMWGRLT